VRACVRACVRERAMRGCISAPSASGSSRVSPPCPGSPRGCACVAMELLVGSRCAAPRLLIFSGYMPATYAPTYSERCAVRAEGHAPDLIVCLLNCRLGRQLHRAK
jgi:hypothetical protein